MTLIELVVVIGLLTLVLGGAVLLWSKGHLAWFSESTQMRLDQDARRAIQAMARELRHTDPAFVTILAAGQAIRFRAPQDLDGDGDVIDAAGAIEWGPFVTYATEGANPVQLVRRSGPTREVLASWVTLVQFQQQPADPRRISMRVVLQRPTVIGHTLTSDQATEVDLRN